MVQMISHGFISGALFLCVGVLYDRVHSREISAYGGVANTMPWFAFFSVLFLMANSGLPGTSGFVGEFMVILASFRANFWYAFLAGLTLILGAAYSLWRLGPRAMHRGSGPRPPQQTSLARRQAWLRPAGRPRVARLLPSQARGGRHARR